MGYKYLIALFFIELFATTEASAQADSAAVAKRDSIYKQMELGGVTVEGRTAIQKDDHTAYMPTQRQVDAANSGMRLLSNLMIPKLLVNLADHSVKNADGSTPTIYIDNRKADATEADRLRPKDILRVEYYDSQSKKFPGEQSVVNFITRKYDRGGYVDVRTSTNVHPLACAGEYAVQAGFDTKKLNITLLGGSGFNDEDGGGTSSTERVGLTTPFTKTTMALEGIDKMRAYLGMVQATYRTDKTTVYANVGLNWQETPTSRYRTAVAYTPEVYPASEATTATTSRYATPSAAFFFETKPDSGQTLRLNATYTHGNNAYSRTYAEGSLPTVVQDTKEKTDFAELSAYYSIDMKHSNSFSAEVTGVYYGTRTDYVGTMAAWQVIDGGGVLVFPQYIQTFSKKITLTVCPGLFWEVYNIEGYGKTSRVVGRPSVRANYKMGNNSSLWAFWCLGTSSPEMSYYNNTEQRVNQYTVKRGNPSLKMEKLHYFNLAYNLSAKNINLSLIGQAALNTDVMKASYSIEGNDLVETYISDGSLFKGVAGVAASWALLGNSLQLMGQLLYNWQKTTGQYATANNRLEYALSANYYLGNFSFTAQYTPKTKYYDGMALWHEGPHQYFFLASWHHKGLFVEVGCQRMFDGALKNRQWFDYGVYAIDKTTTINNWGSSAWVRLSYSFDFGRKKVERTKMDVQKGSSGIMKI